ESPPFKNKSTSCCKTVSKVSTALRGISFSGRICTSVMCAIRIDFFLPKAAFATGRPANEAPLPRIVFFNQFLLFISPTKNLFEVRIQYHLSLRDGTIIILVFYKDPLPGLCNDFTTLISMFQIYRTGPVFDRTHTVINQFFPQFVGVFLIFKRDFLIFTDQF